MRWLQKTPIAGSAGTIPRAGFPLVTQRGDVGELRGSAPQLEGGGKRSGPTQLRSPGAERLFVLVPHEKARALGAKAERLGRAFGGLALHGRRVGRPGGEPMRCPRRLRHVCGSFSNKKRETRSATPSIAASASTSASPSVSRTVVHWTAAWIRKAAVAGSATRTRPSTR